jgi:uncharacterized protein (UPF0335 family)
MADSKEKKALRKSIEEVYGDLNQIKGDLKQIKEVKLRRALETLHKLKKRVG